MTTLSSSLSLSMHTPTASQGVVQPSRARQIQHSLPLTLHNGPLSSPNARWTTACPATCQLPITSLQWSPSLHSPSPSPFRLIPHSTASTTEAKEAAGLESLLSKPAQLVRTEARAFAPATVANLGPGFDFLGCAVDGVGDHVTAKIDVDSLPAGSADVILVIDSITGDNGRLGYDPSTNCIGVAARAALELLGHRVVPGGGGGGGADGAGAAAAGNGTARVTLRLSLEKGLPLGSGLGSSAASAAAAAEAVNGLFGSPLTSSQLVLAGLQSEAAVSGYHADNVAPALMGGFVLVRSYRPLHLLPLAYPAHKQLLFVVVTPAFEAPTKAMRAALPKEISMASHIANSSQGAALVAAILSGDAALLGAALGSDGIVEPRRAPLIPGLSAVKVAAMSAGAYGCTISGAGPTAVAVVEEEAVGERVKEAMIAAFKEQGKLEATGRVTALDRVGARLV